MPKIKIVSKDKIRAIKFTLESIRTIIGIIKI